MTNPSAPVEEEQSPTPAPPPAPTLGHPRPCLLPVPLQIRCLSPSPKIVGRGREPAFSSDTLHFIGRPWAQRIASELVTSGLGKSEYELSGNSFFGVRLSRSTVPSLAGLRLLYIHDDLLCQYVSSTLLEPVRGPENQPERAVWPLAELRVLRARRARLFPSHRGSVGERLVGVQSRCRDGTGIEFLHRHFCQSGSSCALPLPGVPLNTISDSASATVQNSAGQMIKSNLTGFELQFGVSILFPDPPQTGGAK